MLKQLNIISFLLLHLLILSACKHVEQPQNSSSHKNKKKQELFQKELFPDFPDLSKNDVLKNQELARRFYQDYLETNQFSGQFLVSKYGKVIYYNSNGFSNINKNIKMTNSTPLHVASVSKVATSLAILRLVDQKKIILDEDVRTYLTNFPYEGITVRMLLNHRSGLQYYAYFPVEVWNPKNAMTNKDILKVYIEKKLYLNFKPNTKFRYCNSNYAMLALIVEEVTGKHFASAMKDLIFNPLGMSHSFILRNNKMFDKVSKSYNANRQEHVFDYLDAIYGDKNMYTTAYDLLQMDKATYCDNFISDSLRKQMFKGYSFEKKNECNYGLGIRIKEAPNKDTYFFHPGWWHGNTACYATLRNDTVCIIAMSNVYSKNVFQINRLVANYGDFPFQF